MAGVATAHNNRRKGLKLGLYSLEKRRIRGEVAPPTLFHYLNAGYRKCGITMSLKSFNISNLTYSYSSVAYPRKTHGYIRL